MKNEYYSYEQHYSKIGLCVRCTALLLKMQKASMVIKGDLKGCSGFLVKL